MCHLIGLQDVLNYNEINHRITPIHGNLGEFFRGGLQNHDLTANTPIGVNAFQFGWNSYIALRQVDGGLKIERIEQINANNVVEDVTGGYGNRLCNPVVTRAVDVCTFIYVHNGDMHYMFHLDEYCRNTNDFLVGKLREIGGGDGFISLIRDNQAYINCFAATGIAMRVLVRSVNNFNTISPQAREPFEENPDMVNIYGHTEIGLRVKNERVLLFGDVTNIYRGDYMDGRQAPCYRFLSIDGLNGAVDSLSHDLP